MHFFQEKEWKHSYFISTAKNGIGEEEGSGKTPLGLHKIIEKIGDGADRLAIFVSRENTGKIAKENQEKAYITTRILRLEGLEEGFNKGNNENGKCVDSYKRYIYIHGTSFTQDIGKATSDGCIRMHPDEMIDLFGQVDEETLVYIYV